jgi:hypothetical protein
MIIFQYYRLTLKCAEYEMGVQVVIFNKVIRFGGIVYFPGY